MPRNRHEEGAEEVAQPPLEVAVYIVSTGASAAP
jgi:hypothetical protein